MSDGAKAFLHLVLTLRADPRAATRCCRCGATPQEFAYICDPCRVFYVGCGSPVWLRGRDGGWSLVNQAV